ncbi:MAG: phosphoribosylamine--glycine ligase, partial [Cetobacterium sp.]|nr:phosphoribosylamine--glycine ligase [Cetobacterium sp.]
YPHKYVNGYEIENIKDISRYIYHMGTKIVGDKLLTNGGRVLTVLGKGETLEEARVKAYENVSKIKCENLFYRKDIGQK